MTRITFNDEILPDGSTDHVPVIRVSLQLKWPMTLVTVPEMKFMLFIRPPKGSDPKNIRRRTADAGGIEKIRPLPNTHKKK